MKTLTLFVMCMMWSTTCHAFSIEKYDEKKSAGKIVLSKEDDRLVITSQQFDAETGVRIDDEEIVVSLSDLEQKLTAFQADVDARQAKVDALTTLIADLKAIK